MNTPPKPAIFLERTSYKQRRLTDAVRLLPFLGLVLWAIPLLWGAEDEAGPSNADALLYVFGVWVLLIGLSAIIIGRLQDDDAVQPSDSAE
ncbi:MAG: hypothetical protein AAFY14_05320 [Pseudomonadota bacterium]